MILRTPDRPAARENQREDGGVHVGHVGHDFNRSLAHKHKRFLPIYGCIHIFLLPVIGKKGVAREGFAGVEVMAHMADMDAHSRLPP
jgi:hypothetical protein